MLCTGEMLVTSVSMAMYFLSSASKASRLGLVRMKASYVACGGQRDGRGDWVVV